MDTAILVFVALLKMPVKHFKTVIAASPALLWGGLHIQTAPAPLIGYNAAGHFCPRNALRSGHEHISSGAVGNY